MKTATPTLCEQETINSCVGCNALLLSSFLSPSSLHRCHVCELVFHTVRPSQKSIQLHYNSEHHYTQWILDSAARDDLWKRRLEIILRFKQKGRLLDVGAGIGQFLSIASRNFKCLGTELSAAAIALAYEHYAITLSHQTAENMTFDRSFDLITLFHTLEHCLQPEAVIKQCSRHLDEQGMLFIAVPNEVERFSARWYRLKNKIFSLSRADKNTLGIPLISLSQGKEIHLVHFTERSLVHLLERNNFQIISRSIDPSFVAVGFERVKKYLKYYILRCIHSITGVNLSSTILVVAKKCSVRPAA
jgi:2-polyprenyl-3-methyl-5-hydroxy-6-metoxy-1,4-benzoquinol methylase